MLSESFQSKGEKIKEAPCSEKYIAVIDDDYDIRQIMKCLLNRSNHGCLLFENFKEFEKYLDSQENLNFLEMIITDNQMPGIDGVNYCIENKERFKSIPKILITGDHLLNRSDTEEFEYVMYKPFNLCEMINVVSLLTKKIEKTHTKRSVM